MISLLAKLVELDTGTLLPRLLVKLEIFGWWIFFYSNYYETKLSSIIPFPVLPVFILLLGPWLFYKIPPLLTPFSSNYAIFEFINELAFLWWIAPPIPLLI